MTYFCYVDESGTPEVPGTTSHFVLLGLAIPIERWRDADNQISKILTRYDLADAEIHTAWLVRPYLEERKVLGYSTMDRAGRRSAISRYRAGELLRLRRLKSPKLHNQTKKNFLKTDAYIHLSHQERVQLVVDLATCISTWDFAVLFAEAIDKLHFDSNKMNTTIGEQAFEQLVSRFQQFLVKCGGQNGYGVLVHDNNQTVSQKHTQLMRQFHDAGTLWAKIDRIGETLLFVDSKLTRMVQVADLCSYVIRRYVENSEDNLLKMVLNRADKVNNIAVGIRHFSDLQCICEICKAHQPARVARALAIKSAAQSGA